MTAEPLPVGFRHGLGDHALFARVLELYRLRGRAPAVAIPADKAPLYRAVPGLAVAPAAPADHHPWAYPAGMHPAWWGRPDALPRSASPWALNKAAHNLGLRPLPPLDGDRADLGAELARTELGGRWRDVAGPDGIDRAAAVIAAWPRPVVLLHLMGNTSPAVKNVPPHDQMLLVHELLDRTEGTVALLDWDDRVARVPSYRCRRMGDDFPRLDLAATTALIALADLLVSVDSGPLHVAALTPTPALGLWWNHHPGYFALPCPRHLHLADGRHAEFDRTCRVAFRTLLADGPVTARFAAEAAVDLLDGPRWGVPGEAARDAQARGLLRRTRSHSLPLSSYVDRDRTFAAAFDALAAADADDPLVVEVGSMRSHDDWGGAGGFTFLAGAVLDALGRGRLESLEIDPARADFARSACAGLTRVAVRAGDAAAALAGPGPPIDLLYLDGADVGTPGFERQCLDLARAALPRMAPGGRVLVDDTVLDRGAWRGKGALAVPALLAAGWHLHAAGYQALLGRDPGPWPTPGPAPPAPAEPEAFARRRARSRPRRSPRLPPRRRPPD